MTTKAGTTDTSTQAFQAYLHQRGVSDQQIQGAATAGAQTAPGAEAAQPKGGKPEAGDVFAYVFKHFPEHQKKITEHFKSLGLDVSFFDAQGNISPEKLAEINKKLAGEGRGSMQGAAKGIKLPKVGERLSQEAAHGLQQRLVRAAFRGTEFPLLSMDDQEKALRDFIGKQGLSPKQQEQLFAGLKRELNLASQGWNLQKKISHLATLAGRGSPDDKLLRAAIEVDPGNAEAHRQLGARCLKESQTEEGKASQAKLEEARTQFELAIRATDDPVIIGSISKALELGKYPGLLQPGETAESFVGDQYFATGRYDQAKASYEKGLGRAKEAMERAKQNPTTDPATLATLESTVKFLEERVAWAEEKKQPYEMGFDANDNPHAAYLFDTLREAGIPAGALHRKGGGNGAERKISAQEVFQFVTENWSDPRVQGAVQNAQLEIPPELMAKIPGEGLAKVMGGYHLYLAEQLKQAGGDPTAQLTHLLIAGNYLPDNAEIHVKTGDLFLTQGRTFETVGEYLQGSAAASYMDGGINQKLTATLNKAIPETVKAAKEKMEAGDYAGAKALLEPMLTAFKDVSGNAMLLADAMAEAQGKKSGVGTPENFQLVAEASMQMGTILDAENNHEAAVKHYQNAVEFADRTLSPELKQKLDEASAKTLQERKDAGEKDPQVLNAEIPLELSLAKKADAPALMLRSNALMMLGEFSACHANAKKAAELDPQLKPRFDATVKVLEQKAEQMAKAREAVEKETPPHAPTIQAYLTYELQIHEVLGHADKVKELSAKLKDAMGGAQLGPVTQAVSELAAQGLITQAGVEQFNDIGAKGPLRFLDPSAPTKVSDYVTLEESGGKTSLKFNEAFEKLNPGQKLAVMRGLHQAGMRAAFAKMAAEAQDGTQKLYFQTKVHLLDGNISAARLGLTQLKADTAALTDPGGMELHQQVRQELRQLSFAGLQELRGQIETLKQSRELSPDGSKRASRFSERMDYELERLGRMEKLLQDGSIDTLDEGIAILGREDAALAGAGVAQEGVRFTLSVPHPRKEDKEQEKQLAAAVKAGGVTPADLAPGEKTGPYGNIPRVKLTGGVVDVPTYAQGGPSAFAVVVGPEGGTVNLAGRSYTFHRSEGERVVLFRPGFQEYNESNTPPDPLGVKPHQFGHGTAKPRPQDIRDPGLDRLLQFQTREGLEKIRTPETRRQQQLETARAFRQSGEYAMAGQLFEAVIAEEVEKGYGKISAQQYQEMKRKVNGDDKIAKQATEQVEQIKKDPKAYQAQLAQFRETLIKERGASHVPEGAALEQAFLGYSIQAARDGMLGAELRKAAMAEVGKAHGDGKIADKAVAEAWEQYDNMMDPTGNNWAPSDEAWDAIVQQTVIMTAISVATLGAGTAIQAGIAGTRLAAGMAAMGTAGRTAAGVGIYLARNAGEAVVQTGLESVLMGQQFTMKRFGYNLANQMAFHGVMGTWAKTGGKLGEKAAVSLADAAKRGAVTKMQQAVLGAGIKVGNVAGMMAVQATAGTAGTYAEEFLFDVKHPGEFWDRWKDSAKHMTFMHFGMHGLNVASGNWAARSETLARARLDKSRDVYSDLRSRGFQHKDAMKQAVDSAQGLKIDGSGRLYTPGANGERVYETVPGEVRHLATAQEEELQGHLLRAASEEARAALPERAGEAAVSGGAKRAEGAEGGVRASLPPRQAISGQAMIDRAMKVFGLQPQVTTERQIKRAYREWVKKNHADKFPESERVRRGEMMHEADILYRHLLREKVGIEPSESQGRAIKDYQAGQKTNHLGEVVTDVVAEPPTRVLDEVAGDAARRITPEDRQLPPTSRQRLEQAPVRTLMEAFGLKADDATVAKWVEEYQIDPTGPETREMIQALGIGLNKLRQSGENTTFRDIRHPETFAIMDESGTHRFNAIKTKVFEEVLAGNLSLAEAKALGHVLSEGRVSPQQIERATGMNLSPEQVNLRESQLGLSRAEWLAKYADNPEAFNRQIHFIETTTAQINSRVMGCVMKGRMAERAEFKRAMLADLEAQGVQLSTDTGKAIDSMIDIVDTAQRAGLIDQPGGLTRQQMTDMLTTLYLHQSPFIRMGGAELTHVPQVVQGTVDFMAAMLPADMPPAQRAAALKKAFVTALYHDSGKWDVNIRTTGGYTVMEHPFFNGSGRPIEVRANETLAEALVRLQDPAQAPTDQLLTAEQASKVNLKPKEGDAANLAAIIGHHDSANAHKAITEDLVAQGILTREEASEIWQGIERHGLVSSWIVKNSRGEIGVRTKIFEDPRYERFLHGYIGTPDTPGLVREIQSGAISQRDLEMLLRSQDPNGKDLPMELRLLKKKLTALREDFQKLFSDTDRALMLGDHRGQVDPYKYVMAVINSPANAKASVHELLLGGDLSNNVVGVLRNHLIELQLLDPAMASQVDGAFKAGEAWMQNLDPASPGLGKALRDDPTTQQMISDHAGAPPAEINAGHIQAWMESVPAKGADGKMSAAMAAVHRAMERPYYEFSTLSEQRARFQFGAPDEMALPMGRPANDTTLPSEPPPPRKADAPPRPVTEADPGLAAAEAALAGLRGKGDVFTRMGARAEADVDFRAQFELSIFHIPKSDRGPFNEAYAWAQEQSADGSMTGFFGEVQAWVREEYPGARGEEMVTAIQRDLDVLQGRAHVEDLEGPGMRLLKLMRSCHQYPDAMNPSGYGKGRNDLGRAVELHFGRSSLEELGGLEGRTASSRETGAASPPAEPQLETIRPGAAAARADQQTIRPGAREAGTVRPAAEAEAPDRAKTLPPAAAAKAPVKPMSDDEIRQGLDSVGKDIGYLLRLNPQDSELQALNQRIIELERLDHPKTRKEAGASKLGAHSEEFLDIQTQVDTRRLQLSLDSVQQAEAALGHLAPEAWAAFKPLIEQARQGGISPSKLQWELAEACRDGFVEMAHRQMGLAAGEPLPANLEMSLSMVAEGFVGTGLVAKGLRPETVQDFISEALAMYRSIPQADQQPLFAFSLVPTPFTSHNFLGTRPTGDSQMQMITQNLRGYRRLFGEQAGIMFSGQGRLVSEIRDPDGNPSGFHLVVERGQHEGHSGMRLAIYEGTPDPKKPHSFTAQLQLNFGPDGTMQVINLQGPHTRVVDDHVAPAGSLDRFGQVFERGQTMDLLLASAMLLGRNAGYQKMEGIAGQAQRALQDRLRMREQSFDPGQNLYDGTFARFGFRPPEQGGDYWSMDLNRLEIHRQNEPARHRESPGVRRGERPFLPTVGPNKPADYFRQILVRPNRADTVSDKRYQEWDRKIPRGSKDTKGNIRPGPVTEQVQNFWRGFAGALQRLEFQPGPSHLHGSALPEGNPLALKPATVRETPIETARGAGPEAEPVTRVMGRAEVDQALARDQAIGEQDNRPTVVAPAPDAPTVVRAPSEEEWAQVRDDELLPVERARVTEAELTEARQAILKESEGLSRQELRSRAGDLIHESSDLSQQGGAENVREAARRMAMAEALLDQARDRGQVYHDTKQMAPGTKITMGGLEGGGPRRVEGQHLGFANPGGTMSFVQAELHKGSDGNLFVKILPGGGPVRVVTPRGEAIPALPSGNVPFRQGDILEMGNPEAPVRLTLGENGLLREVVTPTSSVRVTPEAPAKASPQAGARISLGDFSDLTAQAFRLGQEDDGSMGQRMILSRYNLKRAADSFVEGLGIEAGPEMQQAAAKYFDAAVGASKKLGWSELEAQRFGEEVSTLVRMAVESGRQGRPSADAVREQAQALMRDYGPEAQQLLGPQVGAMVSEAALAAYRVDAPMPSHAMEGGRVADLTMEALRIGVEGDTPRGKAQAAAAPLPRFSDGQAGEVARLAGEAFRLGRDADPTTGRQTLTAQARPLFEGLAREVSPELAQSFWNFLKAGYRDAKASKLSQQELEAFAQEASGLMRAAVEVGTHGKGHFVDIYHQARDLIASKGFSPDEGTGKALLDLMLTSHYEGMKKRVAEAAAAPPVDLTAHAHPMEEGLGAPRERVEAARLAETNTPFAPVARDFLEGRIDYDTYTKRLEDIGHDLVEDSFPAFAEVMGGLNRMAQDPAFHIATEFPGRGRVKDAKDVAQKILRREWMDLAPLTDLGGARVIIETGPGIDSVQAAGRVIAEIAKRFPVRAEFDAEGRVATEARTEGGQRVIKWDMDSDTALIQGRKSGYRARHVVVEVAVQDVVMGADGKPLRGPDGKAVYATKYYPVEIQIKTDAHHEWSEIQHKLVYKSPLEGHPVLKDAVHDYCKAVSDYLAAATGLISGGLPKTPPRLDAETHRQIDEALAGQDPQLAQAFRDNLQKMEGLMEKYGPEDVSAHAMGPIPDKPRRAPPPLPFRARAASEELPTLPDADVVPLPEPPMREAALAPTPGSKDAGAAALAAAGLKPAKAPPRASDNEVEEFIALSGQVVKQSAGEIRTRLKFLGQVLNGRNGPGARMSDGMKKALMQRIARQPELNSLQSVAAEVAKVAQEVGGLRAATRRLPAGAGAELLELMVRGERTPAQVQKVVQDFQEMMGVAREAGLEDRLEIFDRTLDMQFDGLYEQPGQRLEQVLGEVAPKMRSLASLQKRNPEALRVLSQWVLEGKTMSPEQAQWLSDTLGRLPRTEGADGAEALAQLHVAYRIPAARLEGVPTHDLQALVRHLDGLGLESQSHLLGRISRGELSLHRSKTVDPSGVRSSASAPIPPWLRRISAVSTGGALMLGVKQAGAVPQVMETTYQAFQQLGTAGQVGTGLIAAATGLAVSIGVPRLLRSRAGTVPGETGAAAPSSSQVTPYSATDRLYIDSPRGEATLFPSDPTGKKPAGGAKPLTLDLRATQEANDLVGGLPIVVLKFPPQKGHPFLDREGKAITLHIARTEAMRMGFKFDDGDQLIEVPQNAWFIESVPDETAQPVEPGRMAEAAFVPPSRRQDRVDF